MKIKCHSHILRRYKTRKAESIWPEVLDLLSKPIHNEEADKYPRCNGEVTIKIKAIEEPEWGYSSSALEIEWNCTECKAPYVPGMFEIDLAVSMNDLSINRLIEILVDDG